MTLGGLTFWELHDRGQLISGGLFKDFEVNETLLLAPFLYLIVVALVFMRVFPLLVRFISGESAAVLHLVAVATVFILVPGVAVKHIQEGNGLTWLGPATLLLAAAGVYWATNRAGTLTQRVAGLVLQTALIGGFLALEPPERHHVLFAPTISLALIVPAQVAFLLLKTLMRASPIWLSIGLWRMARNPLEFTWLILLLVLVTGVGVLSTTVGGTLISSQEDRVLYDVAADVRISAISRRVPGGAQRLRQTYEDLSGVKYVSPAFREAGSAGSNLGRGAGTGVSRVPIYLLVPGRLLRSPPERHNDGIEGPPSRREVRDTRRGDHVKCMGPAGKRLP